MGLTQANLRTILATVFSVDQKYIVLRQGNWFNPQAMLPTPDKPDTWISYLLGKGKAKSLPYFVKNEDTGTLTSVVLEVSPIDLQFVGERSEELAGSVAHWLNRPDVIEAFFNYDSVIMAQDFSSSPTPFFQDGTNSILAYNVRVWVTWANTLEATAATIVTTVTETGSVVIS